MRSNSAAGIDRMMNETSAQNFGAKTLRLPRAMAFTIIRAAVSGFAVTAAIWRPGETIGVAIGPGLMIVNLIAVELNRLFRP